MVGFVTEVDGGCFGFGDRSAVWSCTFRPTLKCWASWRTTSWSRAATTCVSTRRTKRSTSASWPSGAWTAASRTRPRPSSTDSTRYAPSLFFLCLLLLLSRVVSWFPVGGYSSLSFDLFFSLLSSNRIIGSHCSIVFIQLIFMACYLFWYLHHGQCSCWSLFVFLFIDLMWVGRRRWCRSSGCTTLTSANWSWCCAACRRSTSTTGSATPSTATTRAAPNKCNGFGRSVPFRFSFLSAAQFLQSLPIDWSRLTNYDFLGYLFW